MDREKLWNAIYRTPPLPLITVQQQYQYWWWHKCGVRADTVFTQFPSYNPPRLNNTRSSDSDRCKTSYKQKSNQIIIFMSSIVALEMLSYFVNLLIYIYLYMVFHNSPSNFSVLLLNLGQISISTVVLAANFFTYKFVCQKQCYCMYNLKIGIWRLK